MRRRGFTLAELITSLVLLGAVLGLVTHAIVGQLRFMGGMMEIARLRNDLSHASGIAVGELWSASPGDITVAQDSALELRATIGSAAVCGASVGAITIPAPVADSGNALSAFTQMPDAGDRVAAYVEDSTGGAWMNVTLASAPMTVPPCATFTESLPAWRLSLRESITIPAGSFIHVLRPLHFSLYKASDNQWYMGARDWNGAVDRFNTIQPVAGPLRPYSSNAALSGLSFSFRDSNSAVLSRPVDPAAVRTVVITVRAETGEPVRVGGVVSTTTGTVRDSTRVTISLRNRS
jgi:prepilin-type N-terminal cleavage/methylation domain-containing protein